MLEIPQIEDCQMVECDFVNFNLLAYCMRVGCDLNWIALDMVLCMSIKLSVPLLSMIMLCMIISLKLCWEDGEHQFVNKELISILVHLSYKHIRKLKIRCHIWESNGFFFLNVLDEMTIHFNMSCMLVIDWIGSNLNGARIVNMECSSKKLQNMQTS